MLNRQIVERGQVLSACLLFALLLICGGEYHEDAREHQEEQDSREVVVDVGAFFGDVRFVYFERFLEFFLVEGFCEGVGEAEDAFADSVSLQFRFVDIRPEAVEGFFGNDVLDAVADFNVCVFFIHEVENEDVPAFFLPTFPRGCEVLREPLRPNVSCFFDDRAYDADVSVVKCLDGHSLVKIFLLYSQVIALAVDGRVSRILRKKPLRCFQSLLGIVRMVNCGGACVGYCKTCQYSQNDDFDALHSENIYYAVADSEQ